MIEGSTVDMDRVKEERERGVTIDLAYQKLITPKRQITIIDAPGHKDFVKNYITFPYRGSCHTAPFAAGPPLNHAGIM